MPRKTKPQPAPEKRGRGRPPRDPNAPAAAPRKSRAHEPSDVGRASYSIPEFCQRNHISGGTYIALRKQARAPREMRPTGKVNGIVRITPAAEADWQRECEQRAVSAEDIAADRAQRKIARAKKAGGES
jgi:hypothetical protein